MTSKEKGYSLSLTTKRALSFLSRCRSTSAGLMAIPSYSNTFQPSVSNFIRRLRGKCLLPWKCRKISWPWVRTEKSLQKYGNRNGWALSQCLWAQSQKTDQHHWSPTLCSFCTSFRTAFFAGAQPCHSHRRLCRWFHPIEEQHRTASAVPTPTGSRYILILWTANVREKKDFVNRKKHHVCEKKNLLNSKQYEERKTIYDDENK